MDSAAFVAELDAMADVAPTLSGSGFLESFPDAPDVRHALDLAPINSKIVVVKREGESGMIAVLATPDGAHPLPKGDPAHRLPDGARIRKIAEGSFIAEQLSPAVDHPRLETVTASDAIGRFVDHFHPRD